MSTKCTGKIGHRAAVNALHGIRYSSDLGRPINLSVCINFQTLGVPEEQACGLFKLLRDKVARWWKHQRAGKGRDVGELLHYYAHANPAGSRHVHWQVHVPAAIWDEFQGIVTKRLRAVLGRVDLGDALHFAAIGGAGSHAKYILKGVDPDYAAHLHIEAANEGLVTGRRTGVSRAMSKAARKAGGWVRKRRPRQRR